MAQKLILPFEGANIFSAGYKNAAYLKQQGYNHYGIDIFGEDSQKLFALGEGMVVACGADRIGGNERMGNCIVLIYKNVQLHSGKVCDLSCRMFHLASISVTKGQVVQRGTFLGIAGNTGSTTVLGKPMGIHLHIEFDTDTKYPQYAIGISGSGAIIKRGSVDSTIDPSQVWYLGTGQSIWGKYAGWYTDADIQLPPTADADDGSGELQTYVEYLEGRIEQEQAAHRDTNTRLKEVVSKIKSLLAEYA